MENNDKIISIKRIKLSIRRDFKRYSEKNNDKNLEHNSHKLSLEPNILNKILN